MNFLEIDYTKPITDIGERLSFGGEMLLLGMGTIFAVLIIIMLALSLFKFFIVKESSNTKTVSSPFVNEPLPVACSNTNEDEIIAVIAAAIAMAESEANGAKFRVVSFRRK